MNDKLRILNFYGSSFPEKKIKVLLDIFPKTNIIYSYGLTEASPRVTYIYRNELEQRTGSSGKPLLNIKLSIEDNCGRYQMPGEIGEIVIDGPNVFKGYYMNKEQTQKVLKNNKLYTSDLGYIDNEGYLYVTGRKDNMIIISGKNVFPEEVESVLNQYTGILETLVCKKDTSTDKLIAYVVEVNKETINVSDLLKYCKAFLEDYKIPTEIIFIDELEKTISGKLKRNTDKKIYHEIK